MTIFTKEFSQPAKIFFFVIDMNRSKYIIAIPRAFTLRSISYFEILNGLNFRALNRFMKFYLFVQQNKRRLRNLFFDQEGKIYKLYCSICLSKCSVLSSCQNTFKHSIVMATEMVQLYLVFIEVGPHKNYKTFSDVFPSDNSYWRVRKYNN